MFLYSMSKYHFSGDRRTKTTSGRSRNHGTSTPCSR